MATSDRVIFHLDVDSFYVACELLRQPHLRGKPVAVTQFNSGGFVAVSNEARRQGVTKGDGIGAGGQKALSYFANRPESLLPAVMQRCPSLTVLPMDTPYYRTCTDNILKQLQQAPCWRSGKVVVEKSSMDDFYIDATAEIKHREAIMQEQLSRKKTPTYNVQPFDAETFVSASEPDSEDEDYDYNTAVDRATTTTNTMPSPFNHPRALRIWTHYPCMQHRHLPLAPPRPRFRTHLSMCKDPLLRI